MKQATRYIFMPAVILITIGALFYAIENRRGIAAWQDWKAELAPRGEPAVISDFALPPLSDEDNAAMHPAFRALTYSRSDGTRVVKQGLITEPTDAVDVEMAARWRSLKLFRSSGSPGEFVETLTTGSSGTEGARSRSLVFLAAVEPHDPLLASVGDALQRPGCQWPDSKRFPVMLLDAFHTFQAKAIALGSVDRLSDAIRTLDVLRRLERCIGTRDGGIWSLLFRVWARQLWYGAAAEVLQAGSVNSEQLFHIGQMAESIRRDPQELRKAFLAERAVSMDLWDRWLSQSHRWWRPDPPFQSAVPRDWRAGVMIAGPKGWWYKNAVESGRMYAALADAADGNRPAAEQVVLAGKLVEAAEHSRSIIMWVAMNTAKHSQHLVELTIAHDLRHQLLVAALELARHRAESGKAPESLADLPGALRDRIPAGTFANDPLRISRDAEGVLTLSFEGPGGPGEPEIVELKFRNW